MNVFEFAADKIPGRVLEDGFDLIFAFAAAVIVPGRNFGVEFPRADNYMRDFFRCDLQHGGGSLMLFANAKWRTVGALSQFLTLRRSSRFDSDQHRLGVGNHGISLNVATTGAWNDSSLSFT
jgi:hypothetical protein